MLDGASPPAERLAVRPSRAGERMWDLAGSRIVVKDLQGQHFPNLTRREALMGWEENVEEQKDEVEG